MRALSRRTAVLAGLAVAGSLFGVSRLTWIQASAAQVTGGTADVAVTGAQASPALVAAAVVALAASLVTSLTTPAIRLVTGPLLILCGVGAVAGAVQVLLDPAGRAASAVTEATGVGGTATTVSLTPWPIAAAVLAALLAVLGVLVLVAGRSWASTARYRRDAARSAEHEDAPDPMSDSSSAWDALSRGEDPSVAE